MLKGKPLFVGWWRTKLSPYTAESRRRGHWDGTHESLLELEGDEHSHSTPLLLQFTCETLRKLQMKVGGWYR